MRWSLSSLLNRLKDLESWVRTARFAVNPKTTRIRRRILEAPTHPKCRPESDGRWVVFDLHTTHVDGQQGRRVFALPAFFLRAGYNVAMVANRGFVGNIDQSLKCLLLSLPLTIIPRLSSFTGSDAVLVTQKLRKSLPAGFRKQILIKTSGRFDPSGDELAFPFTLHPVSLHAGDDLRLDHFRAIPRRWRLFFSGACGSEFYDSYWMRRVFEKVPRSTVVDIIGRELAGELTLRLNSVADLEENLTRDHRGFVVASGPGFMIPSDRWLEVLANASVFVAAPGISYPMCHNIIESMAVGVVPLTEYPEQFYPPLIHGENCLVYSGEGGLISRVREIFAAPPEWLEALSRGAADYYDRRLSPQGFIARVEADPRSTIVVHVKAHERPHRIDPSLTCRPLGRDGADPGQLPLITRNTR